jgi:hypothetical protein
MKTSLLLVVVVLFLSITFPANSFDENIIEWSYNRKLTVEDFQASVDSNSLAAAETNYRINFSYDRADDTVKFDITTKFVKNGSWMRVRTDEILSHEQGHFDIAEIYTRKIRKAILGKQFNYYNFETEADSLYKIYEDSSNVIQELYDKETEHSGNTEKQIKWEKRIAFELMISKKFEFKKKFTLLLKKQNEN